MFEAAKTKAAKTILDKSGELIQSGTNEITALVRRERLDSNLGGIKTDFILEEIFILPSDANLIGDIVTISGTDYEVVPFTSKDQYNGLQRIGVKEPNDADKLPAAGDTWL
uniref:Phage protein n=1 Tax=Hydrogenovibrio crunogenus (strain DSM 25203 / XCL-2) TaxID=317025 RepID=Q31HU4_HYDCU